MQWVFVVLGLFAALSELHSGTFYLAGVAVAAFLTALAGIWIAPGLLPYVFPAFCVALLPVIVFLRRHLARDRALPDADIGQLVTVVDVSVETRRLAVSYRGSRWEAIVDNGPLPAPGQVAIITAKTDNLLHLTVPAEAKRN